MLESISVQHTGPASSLSMDLAPRLNLLTGDNGLGKSFLLDVAWWVVTESWANGKVLPQPGRALLAKIEGRFMARGGLAGEEESPPIAREYSFSQARADWVRSAHLSGFNRLYGGTFLQEKGAHPPVAVYASINADFSIFDPVRNFQEVAVNTWGPDRVRVPRALQFSSHELWHGLQKDGSILCNGMLQDWIYWQQGQSEADRQQFRILQAALELLSPPGEPIRIGEPTRVLGDARRFPSIVLPAETIPVSYASAAIKRMLSLAYALVWAWNEHKTACEQLGIAPSTELLLLIDEIENHLHPRWQRTILRALLKIVQLLTGQNDVKLQLLVVTHSPLILASAEPHFDDAQDAWFDFDLVQGTPPQVVLSRRAFVRQGDVSNWLTSDAFDLEQSRSVEAEAAIKAALALVKKADATTQELNEAHVALQATLGDTDRFWVRWSQFRSTQLEQRGAGP